MCLNKTWTKPKRVVHNRHFGYDDDDNLAWQAYMADLNEDNTDGLAAR